MKSLSINMSETCPVRFQILLYMYIPNKYAILVDDDGDGWFGLDWIRFDCTDWMKWISSHRSRRTHELHNIV